MTFHLHRPNQRSCKECGMKLREEQFPIAYHYKGRAYHRWVCKPCCADSARERRAK